MGLRDFYYSLENKYYGLLDKLDKNGIKVYKVVDPIDKVIPSFVLVIILFGLILVGIILGIIFAFGVNFPDDPVTFVFTDKYGEDFSNQQIAYSFNGVNRGFISTNELGAIHFSEAKNGDVFSFEVPKGNSSETYTKTITKEKVYSIKLNFSLAKDSATFSVNSVDGMALKPINIDFTCSNYSAIVPESVINSTTSRYNLSFDSECGRLTAKVTSNYYDEAVEEIYDGVNINLRPKDYSGNMQINVNIYDESTSLPITGEASVNLFLNGIALKMANKISDGVYVFAGVSAGTYTVNVTKSGYTSQNKMVTLDGTSTSESIAISLKKNSGLGNFNIKVFDTSQKPIKDVKIILHALDEAGKQKSIVSQNKTDANGFISLDIPDISQKYWLTATKATYETISRTFEVPEEELTIVMRKTNEKKLLRIKVLDELSYPVNNANVALMDGNGNVVEPYFGVTDFNGVVKNGVGNGTYKAYVFKGAFSGESELFEYDSDALNANDFVVVTLTLPKASWDITLKDSYGMPVPNALVSLYDAYNYEPIEIGNKYASPEGILSLQNLRVDRKYFAVVTARSFDTYISKSKFLVANGLASDTFIMEKEKLDKSVNIESLGTFDLENNKVHKLAPDTEYVSRFKIVLPFDSKIKYENLYANFVLGNSDIIEKEPMFIKKVEYSGNALLMKGSYYDIKAKEKTIEKTRSFDNVIYDGSPFQDQIKWLQLDWDLDKHDVNSGILFVDVYLQVRAGISEGSSINLNYNIFVEDAEENMYSSPVMQNLEKEHAGLFNSLKQISLVVGEGQQVCDSLFCFEGSYLDLTDDLRSSVLGELPYVSKVGRNYTLNFKLVNNRTIPLTNYRIIIENPQKNLEMTSGTIYSADNVNEEKPNPEKFEDNFIFTLRSTASLNQNSVIKGDIDFTPIKEGSNAFKITVIEDKEIIYTKEFYVTVVANKEISLEMIPEILPAYVDTNIDFTVKDSENNAYIEDAFVRIVNVYDMELASSYTNEFGQAKLTIKAQNPNTDLYIKVYKENYKAFEKTIRTSDKFITINPEELSVKANVFEMRGEGSLELKNTSKLPVVIAEIYVEGNFDEYVNVLETNNYLANSSKDLEMDKEHNYKVPVKVSLTTIASYLKESIEYEGKLVIVIKPKDDSLGKLRPWTYEVPLKLFISLGKGLDNLDCLGLDKAKSDIIANNGKNDSDSLTVVNGCTVDGVPVKIRNLEAKINWKGNALGAFTFVKNEISSRVQSAYYVTLLTSMMEHEESMFVLNFSPATGRVAGTNKAEIELRASYFTDNGIEFITNKIEYTVSVIDMKSCVTYDLPEAEVDLIKVPKDSKVQFKVRNDCEAGFDLRLTDLPKDFMDIRPKEFTLPAKGEVVVTVDPNNSPVGVYLLEVRGKIPKSNFNGVRVGAEALRVFVAPLETDCLVLDNYEFNLRGKTDENRYAYLINRCYYKDVQALYNIDVTYGKKDCVKENWTGIIKAAFGGLVTSGITGASLGKLFNEAQAANKPKPSDKPDKPAEQKTEPAPAPAAGAEAQTQTPAGGQLNQVKEKEDDSATNGDNVNKKFNLDNVLIPVGLAKKPHSVMTSDLKNKTIKITLPNKTVLTYVPKYFITVDGTSKTIYNLENTDVFLDLDGKKYVCTQEVCIFDRSFDTVIGKGVTFTGGGYNNK